MGGVPLRVREWGKEDAPPLVYWHGLNPFGALELNEAGPVWANEYGFRVIAPAAPGGGDSPPLADLDAYRPTRLADLVAALLAALTVDRAAYVGYSWGASIGMHFAARHAERLAALVLLDAGYTDLQDRPDYEDEPREELITAFEEAQARFRFDRWDEFFAAMRERRPNWRASLEERLAAGMREEADGTLVARADATAAAAAWHGVALEPPATTTLHELAALELPILLLTASQTLARPDGARALERFRDALPRADVVTLESGHDLLGDAPAETIHGVGRWLRQATITPA